MAPGESLPPTRRLVEDHRVSPVTVSRALALLAGEGLVVTRPGAGTFVAPRRPAARPEDYSWQTIALGDRVIDAGGLSPLLDPPHAEGTISLATGYLHSSLMPTRAMSAALARAARIPGIWERPPAAGLHGLRAWFAQVSASGADARDVIITPGGQGAVTATVRALVPAGGPLLVESPTYPGVLAIARAAGVRPVPVPVDGEGVRPDLLAEAFGRTGAQAFYCQPLYQNPTGATLAPGRRAAVLDAAAAAGAFVIEDDYARWLGHGGRPPASLLSEDRDGRVVYVSSLTKTTSPSLRAGAVIARGPVAQRLIALRVVDDMFVARPVQEAVLELVSRPAWEQHLRHLSLALASRSRRLAAALAAHLPGVVLAHHPAGGMHLWIRLPAGTDDADIARRARQAGVLVLPGTAFFPADAPAAHLRLTYCSTATEDDLEEGVRRLAVAVPELAARG